MATSLLLMLNVVVVLGVSDDHLHTIRVQSDRNGFPQAAHSTRNERDFLRGHWISSLDFR
uniref:hypothetical protein n=1 Tax=Cupriavidus yeoncheonensis TaxID=1462994 RepID=UPI003F491D17